MEENFESFDKNAIQFRHPFTLTLSGSTGSGKSEWVMNLLRNLETLVTEKMGLILYCYGELNKNIMTLQKVGVVSGHVKVVTHAGLPREEMVRKRAHETGGKLLLVLDDLMVGMDQQFLDVVFTRGSHNWGVSVCLLAQHLFAKELRVARNNSHYLVLMRNPSGALQTRTLASQLFPGRAGVHFMEAYKDETARNFGYLLIDIHPESPEALRLKTNIYGEEGEASPVVYIAK